MPEASLTSKRVREPEEEVKEAERKKRIKKTQLNSTVVSNIYES